MFAALLALVLLATVLVATWVAWWLVADLFSGHLRQDLRRIDVATYVIRPERSSKQNLARPA